MDYNRIKILFTEKTHIIKKLRNSTILLEDFKSYKRLLNSAIKQAKSLYYLKKILQFQWRFKANLEFHKRGS